MKREISPLAVIAAIVVVVAVAAFAWFRMTNVAGAQAGAQPPGMPPEVQKEWQKYTGGAAGQGASIPAATSPVQSGRSGMMPPGYGGSSRQAPTGSPTGY